MVVGDKPRHGRVPIPKVYGQKIGMYTELARCSDLVCDGTAGCLVVT